MNNSKIINQDLFSLLLIKIAAFIINAIKWLHNSLLPELHYFWLPHFGLGDFISIQAILYLIWKYDEPFILMYFLHAYLVSHKSRRRTDDDDCEAVATTTKSYVWLLVAIKWMPKMFYRKECQFQILRLMQTIIGALYNVITQKGTYII